MAETAVAFFVLKLSNLILQEASLFGQVEGQVKLLRNELEWMRLFLKDADSKRIYDHRVRLWVNQIRSATHDAEDVIDEFILKVEHRRQRLDRIKLLKYLPTWVGFTHKLPFIHELDSRVKDLNVLIGAIMANRSKYGLESLEVSRTSTNEIVSHKEKRHPVVEENEAVGIEDGNAMVKEMLMKSETRRTVVSIVGMGGLGKTTLAKKVYNQRDVQQHFDCKAWVYVSQEFKAKEILLDIAYSVMPLNSEEKKEVKTMRERELGEKLCKYLEQFKYLVVMDDVWCNEVWNSLCSFLPEANQGSKVLITTRNKEVALHATSQAFIYQLRPMNDDESWQLFLKKAFQGTRTSCALTRDLEELGKQIVSKCKRLPLAIVVLGGLLSTKERSKASWEKVITSMEWHLNRGPESCMGILALSYDDLPYYLKSCFLYCGIFPEDYEIRVSKLIHLWMAEGFVQRRGNERPEDVGEEYVQELIHRNLIQVARRGLDGRVKSCRMHDLLRDLAGLEAKDAKFFEVHENLDFTYPSSVRRLVIHEDPKENISQYVHNSQLRSLFLFRKPMGKKGWEPLQKHLKLLTVLNLGYKYIFWGPYTNVIPRELGQLIHLKFLSIDGSGYVGLPSSIGKLVNLQGLELGFCPSLMPHSLWNLQQLRHLHCPRGKVLSQSKIGKCVNGYLGVDQLTNLQTLSISGGSWLKGDALGKLTQLRKLSLYELRAPYLKKGLFESIAKLTALRTLNLTIGWHPIEKALDKHLGLEGDYSFGTGGYAKLFPGLLHFSGHLYLHSVVFQGKLEKLPEQIEFYPPNLLQLTLSECWLKDDPNIILEKLPLLRILTIQSQAYDGKKLVYSPGGFPQLESLSLNDIKYLEDVIIEEGAMSGLKKLSISDCLHMRRLPSGWSHLTKLETLSCKKSCSESIEDMRGAGGEDWDKLSKILVDY